jgi:hypothetical protein
MGYNRSVTLEISQPWQVVYYHDQRGRRPVREFLDGLRAPDRAAVLRSFALLEEFGLEVGWPHVRPVSGYRKLWELRPGAGRRDKAVLLRPHRAAFRHPARLRQEERQDAPARIGDCGAADAGRIRTGGVRDNGYRSV